MDILLDDKRSVSHRESVRSKKICEDFYRHSLVSVQGLPQASFFSIWGSCHHQRCFCLSKECEVAMEHYRKEEKRVGDYYFIL